MIAEIVWAAAGLVVALALLVGVVLGRRIHVRLGRIDAAVNNVPDGSPTLRQVVDEIADVVRGHDQRLVAIEQHLTAPKPTVRKKAS